MKQHYLINFLTLKVTKTSEKYTGLVFNRKDFIYGFVVEADDLVSATDTLNAVEKKWSAWVNEYNTWVGLDKEGRAKYVRKST